MPFPVFPSLYQINTRVWLRELSGPLGRRASLDDVPEPFLDELAALGFDWVWLTGVWQTGEAGRAVSRRHPDWRRDYEEALPDVTDEDITGSPFAVAEYAAHKDFGGTKALARLRERLTARGIKLLLDFVPNHTALDHAWASEHPEYYVGGNETDLAHEPYSFVRVETLHGPRVLAHGRDPNYAGWPDTLQLNYRSFGLRQAMLGELERIAGACDGVRCDMAMLVLPDVIDRTWGNRSLPSDGLPPIDVSFWPEAISRVRGSHPDFLFMAEVYWDLEWELQQEGFDYTYDKRLYDRLRAQDAQAVRGHFWADAEFQRKSVRFLENHDEPRAAAAFPFPVHQAAAIIAYLCPGLRFFHEGQFEGRKKHVTMHLGRRPFEQVDSAISSFYRQLLALLRLPAIRSGQWQLLECISAWEGNPTAAQFLAFAWDGSQGEKLLVTVNYGPTQGQCYVSLPWNDLTDRVWNLSDQLSPARYERDGLDLATRGLYLDMPAWGYHVFDVAATS